MWDFFVYKRKKFCLLQVLSQFYYDPHNIEIANKKHQTQMYRTSVYTCFLSTSKKDGLENRLFWSRWVHGLKEKCPVDLTGHASFSPTVKPFLRVAVLATLKLYPPQVAIWLTFSTFRVLNLYKTKNKKKSCHYAKWR